VDGLREAIERLRECVVDAVLVPAPLLGESWEKVDRLRGLLQDPGRLIVLCPRIGRSERRLAGAHDIGACAYRPGQEREIVTSMLSQYSPAMESC
jgi:hypothetical protein